MKYLEGEHVRLRATEPEDLDVLYAWENDSDIWLVSDTLVPFSRYQLRCFLENDRHDIFAAHQLRMMIDLHDGRTVGTIDLFDFDARNGRAGLGILIASPEDRRKGLAAEALGLLADYCRDVLQLHQVYACVPEHNTASRRLFAASGYALTGVRREWLRTPNGYEDEMIFQLMLDSPAV